TVGTGLVRSSDSLLYGHHAALVAIGHGLSVRYTRTATKLYNGGRLFACRHCYRLGYASQQESAHVRGFLKAQGIRMKLGGSANMLDDFPEKPKGMHSRTYERLSRVHDAARARSFIGLTDFAKRLSKRAS